MTAIRRPRYVAPPGAASVAMPAHDDLQDAIEEMQAVYGALVVDGPTGTGKTFATELACRRLSIPTVTSRLGPRPGTSKVVTTIYIDVTGQAPPRRSTEAERLLEQVLAEKPRLLVIDEAQKLGRSGIDQIVHLHEHQDAQFTVVLVGMGLARLIGQWEELVGRFARTVRFDRLRDDALITWLQAYHPILARTDPQLLRRVDNRHWKGNLRRWAQTTHAAYNRLDDPDVDALTEDLADECVAAVKGAGS